MKAKIINPQENGKNLSNKKELVSGWSFVVNTRKGIREPVKVRWYMARAAHASRVYCSIWISGNGIFAAGNGWAGGGGYCKISAAMEEAIASAGIKLSEEIGGVGESAMRDAGEAIVKALGFTGTPYLVRHA